MTPDGRTVGRISYNGRVWPAEEWRPGMKPLYDNAEDDDRILGFTMIGTEAGEVMAAVHTAMLASLSYPILADAAFAHPTMAEGLSLLFSNVPARSEHVRDQRVRRAPK